GADLLPRGQPLEEAGGLQLDADAGHQSGVSWPGRLAEDRHLTAVRLVQSLDDLQGVRLSGAIWAEEPEKIAFRDLKRDAVHRPGVAVGLVQVGDRDGRGHGRHLTR